MKEWLRNGILHISPVHYFLVRKLETSTRMTERIGYYLKSEILDITCRTIASHLKSYPKELKTDLRLPFLVFTLTLKRSKKVTHGFKVQTLYQFDPLVLWPRSMWGNNKQVCLSACDFRRPMTA